LYFWGSISKQFLITQKDFSVNQKIKLSILGISHSQVQAGAYALIFAEENGVRRLPVVIGSPEAQSIAIIMENIKPPRPLSHDLMFSIFKQFNIELTEILIYKYDAGAFFSELLLKQNQKEFRLDCRTSDAAALALRTKSPIYITEEIMQNMAVVFHEQYPISENSPEEMTGNREEIIDELRLETLKIRLDEALQEEDYELATRLRDEINRRGPES
jgi:bifunctional DNase/RNase